MSRVADPVEQVSGALAALHDEVALATVGMLESSTAMYSKSETDLLSLLSARYSASCRDALELGRFFDEIAAEESASREARNALVSNAVICFMALAIGPAALLAGAVARSASESVLEFVGTTAICAGQSAVPALMAGIDAAVVDGRREHDGSFERAIIEKLHATICARLTPMQTESGLRDLVDEVVRELAIDLPHGPEAEPSRPIVRRVVAEVQNRIRAVVRSYNEEVKAVYESLAPEHAWATPALDMVLRKGLRFGLARCQLDTRQRILDVTGEFIDDAKLFFDSIAAGTHRQVGERLQAFLGANQSETPGPLAAVYPGGIEAKYSLYRKTHVSPYDNYAYKRRNMLAALRLVADVIRQVTGDVDRSVYMMTDREKQAIFSTLMKVALQTPEFTRHRNPMLYLLAHFAPLVEVSRSLSRETMLDIIERSKPVSVERVKFREALGHCGVFLPSSGLRLGMGAAAMMPSEVAAAHARYIR